MLSRFLQDLNYRIAGKFGGEKFWRIGYKSCLLANIILAILLMCFSSRSS